MNMDGIYTEKKQPRKIMKVNDIYKHSEYVQVNRKYWKSVIEGLDSRNKSAVSIQIFCCFYMISNQSNSLCL